MAILRVLANIFLLPGTLVLKSLNVSPEADGGILRSFINMIFWGFGAVIVYIPFMLS